MKPGAILTHQFVESVPQVMQQDIVYVSIPFATVIHKCCCGCGEEVVTPLSPTDWKLTFDGVSISLEPSIGNWSSKCQSHYWITRNRVRWAARWTPQMVAAGRAHDARAKQTYFPTTSEAAETTPNPVTASPLDIPVRPTFWQKIRGWFRRK